MHMALVVVCGQPCSGKSTVAINLVNALKSESDSTVKLVGDSSFDPEYTKAYANAVAEKNLRGALRSEVERSLTTRGTVIVDSLNNIKGYRYELWCLARAAGVRHCVLLCDTEARICQEWDQMRRERGEAAYEQDVFDDLMRRFEKPDRRNRWDSPLFEVHPHGHSVADVVSCLMKDPGSRDVKLLRPTIATQSMHSPETGSLYELDRATQEVIHAIVDGQSHVIGGSSVIRFGKGMPALDIPRIVGLPELRKLRRAFISLTTQSGLSGPRPSVGAGAGKRMFVDYLRRELGST